MWYISILSQSHSNIAVCECMLGHLIMSESLQLCRLAYQAPLSMGFSRQEYCSGLPCPPPGDHADPGIKPTSLLSSTFPGILFTTSATWEAPYCRWQGAEIHSALRACMHDKSVQSCPTLCDPMDCSLPGPLSIGFSRKNYWSGLSCRSSGDLPNLGTEPISHMPCIGRWVL